MFENHRVLVGFFAFFLAVITGGRSPLVCPGGRGAILSRLFPAFRQRIAKTIVHIMSPSKYPMVGISSSAGETSTLYSGIIFCIYRNY